MRFLIRNTVFFILTAIILFLNITCAEPNDNTDASPYLGNTLNVKGEQVWMPNYNTGKVSQMLLKFNGDRTVDVVVDLIVSDGGGNLSFIVQSVGSGKIEKGILDFKVYVMDDSKLLDSDELLLYFFNEWCLDKAGNDNISIDTADVKGNIITLIALYQDDSKTIPAEGVIREGFSGTDNSLTGEYIYYIYVNKDCKITANEVKKPGLEYTFNKFDLSLKAGWNTICKSETYTTTGDSSYSMKVKNPSINWVMQKISN